MSRLGISRIPPRVKFIDAVPCGVGDTAVLLPSDLFFFQQRPASPTIAGTGASGPSIPDTSSKETPQMDEKASRCFICCKCSVWGAVHDCACACVFMKPCICPTRSCVLWDIYSYSLCLQSGPIFGLKQSHYCSLLCLFTLLTVPVRSKKYWLL